MPTLNKTSVRESVNKIKDDFEKLDADNKLSLEVKIVMQSMLTIIELILTIFLEKSTKKNSDNSSIPPSQTGKDESALEQPGSHTKGKPEHKDTINNTRIKETVTMATVELCSVCGENLTTVPCQHHERRTRIDIVFEKVVDHIDAEVKNCPTCHSTNKGRFPSDMPGPLQYGNGLKAFVVNLLVCQMVALGRTQKLVQSMIGTLMSEATLLKFVLRLHQSLEVWERSAVEQQLKAKVIHVDETSLRVDKKNHWIHVYSSGDITLKFLHRKRGREAMIDINIIPRYGGVIVHDCWQSYFSFACAEDGLCGSHLTRELTFIVESNDYRWARNMKRLLLDSCASVSKKANKKLSDKEYATLQRRYRYILTMGEKELPEIPPKPKGKRGRVAKSDAHNLWERLKKHEKAVLLFARNSHVPFTNNRAEQDLRMAKVKQKVSGCFRTIQYAQAYCRISSYLQTMANRGVNPLIAIQMALAGKISE